MPAGELANSIGNKGYVGNGMLSPIKNPPTATFPAGEREINKIRYLIEQIIGRVGNTLEAYSAAQRLTVID